MAIKSPDLIHALLLETPQGKRFVQASPIMPSLWIGFAQAPATPQELILTPHSSVRAGVAAGGLRRVLHWRRSHLRPWKPLPRREDLKRTRVAGVAAQIAARVYLSELVAGVLPLTSWWHELVGGPSIDSERAEASDMLLLLKLFDGLVAALAAYGPRSPIDRGVRVEQGDLQIPAGLVWLVRLAGAIALSEDGSRSDEGFETDLRTYLWPSDQPLEKARRAFATQLVQAFLRLFGLERSPQRKALVKALDMSPPYRVLLHRVLPNRTAEQSIQRSVLTTKADAARQLFHINCNGLTWAIIDSGIDREHPAFLDHAVDDGSSRVDDVFDFRLLRDLNDFEFLNVLLDADEPAADPFFQDLLRRTGGGRSEDNIRRILEEHRRRLEEDLDTDWSLLSPLIRDDNPTRPRSDHGTHVAGILAADWREPAGRGSVCRQVMTGVCPDIRLVDMRVFRDDGLSDEFEIIAALEFLRFLNNRAGRLAIQGANLSLSIAHNLKGGDACGQTPVCRECEKTVAAGIVVIVAAGNKGVVEVRTTAGLSSIYSDSSITDPGNAEAVITVGATHRNRPHEFGVSFFSSRGPTGDGRLKPDLVAPGEKIVAPVPDESDAEKDGTSMAAPHVSGAAALVMGRNPELIGKPRRIKALLCDTATDLGRESYFQGAGLLDVLRALQAI